ncbi:MAG: esterase-like activity of phytase family protein [Bacteroidota bacterium]
MLSKKLILLVAFIVVSSCAVTKKANNRSLELRFLDEYIIPAETIFNEEEIGGLSGIDYQDGKLFLIDDRSSKPIIYEAELIFTQNKIDSIVFTNSINLKQTDPENFKQKALDLESIRIESANKYWLASEGNINKGKNGSVFYTDSLGNYKGELELPQHFKIDSINQPRHNAVFEGIALDNFNKGIWISTEMPLVNDGHKPFLWNSHTPIRLSFFSQLDYTLQKEVAYELERVVRLPLLPFIINGVTEILVYQPNQLLVMERAFSAGRGKKSNRVKLFLAHVNEATETQNYKRLKNYKNIDKVEKELILDLQKIRNKIPSKIIDNLEGMCFGPKLTNGNQTLILVSDNNFNTFGKQITQFLIFEIIP